MGTQRQPFQVLFCGQRRGSACGRQGCTAGTSASVSLPGEQRRQRFPRRSAGRGAGKAPAASRSAGGTLIPTIEHPTGRRKRLPFCFIRSNSPHAVRLRDSPSCSTGSGYRSSAKAPLRACSACCAKGGKLRDGSEGQTGKGMLFPGFRRSGAAEPVRLHRTSLCAFVSAFRAGRVLFPDAQGEGLRGGAGTCGGHSAQKTGCTGHTPRSRFSVGFYGILAAVFRRISLGGFSRFVLCPVGRTALPARYECCHAVPAVLAACPPVLPSAPAAPAVRTC